MDPILEKCADSSRSLLFGLLLGCIFSGEAKGGCPLSQLRDSLSFEEKYDFVMNLSREEICQTLKLHENCFSKNGC